MTTTKSTETATGNYHPVMSEAIVFDSHGFVKRMTGGGFTEQQAETMAVEQSDLLNNLATRQDIKGINARLDNLEENMATMATRQSIDIKAIREVMATKQDIKALREDMATMATKQSVEVKALREDMAAMATQQSAEVKALWEVMAAMATRENMAAMATQQSAELKALWEVMATKQDIEVSIQKLHADMIKWITWYFLSSIGVVLAGVGVMGALLKLA